MMGNFKPYQLVVFVLILVLGFYIALRSPESKIENSASLPLPQTEEKKLEQSVLREVASRQDSIAQRKLQFSRLQTKREPQQMQPLSSELADFEMNTPDSNWKIWTRKKALRPESASFDLAKNIANFSIADAPQALLRLDDFSSREMIVLFDERLGKMGILTGTLALQLKSNDQWPEIEREHSLRLIHTIPGVKLFYVTSQALRFNLLELFENLQNNSAIEKVELEILSRNYASQ